MSDEDTERMLDVQQQVGMLADLPSPFEHDPADDNPCQKTWGWHDEHWCDEQAGHDTQHFCPCGDERDLDTDRQEEDRDA